MKFIIDVGLWEKGKAIERECSSISQALHDAEAYILRNQAELLQLTGLTDPDYLHVVQIKVNYNGKKVCVWDYHNGVSIHQDVINELDI